MDLPNKEHLWTWGMSLGLYSKPYRETGGTHENTTQGEMINLFKYHEDIAEAHRTRISNEFAREVFGLLANQLRPKFPTSSKLPFDVCVGLPENRGTGRSLPRNICRILADEHKWLKDGFEGVTKTRCQHPNLVFSLSMTYLRLEVLSVGCARLLKKSIQEFLAI